MKIRTKVIIATLCILAFVTALAGIFLPAALHDETLDSISENSESQLKLIDYSISNLMTGIKSQVLEMSRNPEIRDPGSNRFTDNPDEEWAPPEGNISDEEQEIIDVLYDYSLLHSCIFSAYLGCENGAYLSSDGQSISCDPRIQPWYLLAEEDPYAVLVTTPHRPVTTPDMSIGVVKALTDENGTVCGVVGIDRRCHKVSEFISGIDPIYGGELVIFDSAGRMISGEYPSSVFTGAGENLNDNYSEFLSSDGGSVDLNDNFLVYYKSPTLGWKIGLLIPHEEIEKETDEAILSVFIYFISGLILLSAMSLIILDLMFIKPISDLTKVSRKITETGDLNQKIEVRGKGEIKTLALAFEEMVTKLRREEDKLNQALKNEQSAKFRLKCAHDELEGEVRRRTAELADANANLKEIDRMKSMFIASMNHELRTPLNLIIGFTDLILHGHSGSITEVQEKQLGIIARSSSHLLGLINEMIEISRIESGMFEPSVSSFDLVSVIKGIADSFNEYALGRNISLITDLPKDLEIFGDEQRTKQILINLTDNAIKYSDRGTVTITAKREGDNAVISVKDRGIGIPEDKLKDLFIPFVRIYTDGRDAKGTGLGLYISEKTARVLGGRISVESVSGEGSRFTLTLPLMLTAE